MHSTSTQVADDTDSKRRVRTEGAGAPGHERARRPAGHRAKCQAIPFVTGGPNYSESVTLLQASAMPRREVAERSRVGVPIEERALVDAFLMRCAEFFRPGPGRSVFVLEEPDLGGSGRPDLVFVAIAPSALRKYMESGLRLTSQASARVLDPSLNADQLGVSTSYASALRRSLASQGWSSASPERLAAAVADTLAVEAKMRDWKRALNQVSKFRRLFHRSAILMPERPLPADTYRSLDFYGCGLLFRDGDEFTWEKTPGAGSPSVWSRLWLLELIVRGHQNGTAYRLSAERNWSMASW